jgi:hypothetical protein
MSLGEIYSSWLVFDASASAVKYGPRGPWRFVDVNSGKRHVHKCDHKSLDVLFVTVLYMNLCNGQGNFHRFHHGSWTKTTESAGMHPRATGYENATYTVLYFFIKRSIFLRRGHFPLISFGR